MMCIELRVWKFKFFIHHKNSGSKRVKHLNHRFRVKNKFIEQTFFVIAYRFFCRDVFPFFHGANISRFLPAQLHSRGAELYTHQYRCHLTPPPFQYVISSSVSSARRISPVLGAYIQTVPHPQLQLSPWEVVGYILSHAVHECLGLVAWSTVCGLIGKESWRCTLWSALPRALISRQLGFFEPIWSRWCWWRPGEWWRPEGGGGWVRSSQSGNGMVI